MNKPENKNQKIVDDFFNLSIDTLKKAQYPILVDAKKCVPIEKCPCCGKTPSQIALEALNKLNKQ